MPEGRCTTRLTLSYGILMTLLVFGTALGLRVAHLADYLESPLSVGDLMPDAHFYEREALRIARGEDALHVPYYLAPLYPLELAAVDRFIVGVDDAMATPRTRRLVALTVQCVMGATSASLIAWIATILFGRLSGTLAGITAAAYRPFIFHEVLIMPSALILLVNLLALLVIVLALRRERACLHFFVGLALGIAAVAHGTALLLVLLVVVWRVYKRPPKRRRALAWAALIALGAALPIGIVFARNIIVGGEGVLLTSNAGRNLLIGNGPKATGSFVPLPAAGKGGGLKDYVVGFERGPDDPSSRELSARYTMMALRHIAAHPVSEIGLLWRKTRLLFSVEEVGINDCFAFAQRESRVLGAPLPSFALIGPLGLLGAVLAWPRRRELAALYIVAGGQATAYLIMFVLGRYRLTLVACLIIFASALPTLWVEHSRSLRKVLLIALALLLVICFVNWPVAGFGPERGAGIQQLHVGKVLASRKEFTSAARALESALEADFRPKNAHFKRADAFLQLGGVREELRQLDAARRAYEAGLHEAQQVSSSLGRRYLIRELKRGLASLEALDKRRTTGRHEGS